MEGDGEEVEVVRASEEPSGHVSSSATAFLIKSDATFSTLKASMWSGVAPTERLKLTNATQPVRLQMRRLQSPNQDIGQRLDLKLY